MTSTSLRAPRPELSSLKLLDLPWAIHTCSLTRTSCLQCECASPNRWGLSQGLVSACHATSRFSTHLHLPHNSCAAPATFFLDTLDPILAGPHGQPPCCSPTPPPTLSMGHCFSRDARLYILQYIIFNNTFGLFSRNCCPFQPEPLFKTLELVQGMLSSIAIILHSCAPEHWARSYALSASLCDRRLNLYWCSSH